MNPTIYKIIVLGVPALILALGLTVGVLFIIRSNREEKRNKDRISGFLFYHPLNQSKENAVGTIIDHADKTKYPTPTTAPFWYRFRWYLPKTPFYFFYEDLVTADVKVVVESYKCLCGYDAKDGKALHAHSMWNPHRMIDGKPALKEEWQKVHSKVVPDKPPEAVPTSPVYKIKNYEPHNEKMPPILTPFDIFDINNWDCQREFHKKRLGNWEKAINMGAGVVLACVCLFVSFVVISEVQKKDANPNTPTQATTLEVTK